MKALQSSIPDVFRARVRDFPEKVALESDDCTLTYAELGRAVEAVSARLMQEGVDHGTRVILLADQSASAVVATLGILGAAAAYVPLDPLLPAEHIQTLLAHAEPTAVLATDRYEDVAHQVCPVSCDVICLEKIGGGNATPPPSLRIAPESAASIYYTSGSTGRPKGVCNNHRNVLHNIWRYTTNLQITEDDRLTLLQAPHFSGAVSSMFCALLNGGTCLPYDVRRDGVDGIGAWLRGRRITMFHGVPAIFRAAIMDGPFPDLRCVRLEGDRTSHHDLELFQERCASGTMLANGLGATECGLVRQWRITTKTRIPDGPIPIGAAIADMDVVLLDEEQAPVLRGENGEIAVRSRYLATGYWKQPELTAQKFLPDRNDPSCRIYLTGDLGRFTSDETLLYLGRKDFQPKIRGQWVDLDAIERELTRISGVREAAVAVREDSPGEPRLAAYIIFENAVTGNLEEVRREAALRLSSAMMPASWTALTSLPLNTNLKVDRLALPAPAALIEAGPAAQPDPPRTELERTLHETWSKLLGRADFGIHDDLIGLGADSLMMTRVNNRVSSTIPVDLPLATFFLHPTIAAQAGEIESRLSS